MRLEKGTEVLSNEKLRTRDSLMVYTEMQFKSRFRQYQPVLTSWWTLLNTLRVHRAQSQHRDVHFFLSRRQKNYLRLFIAKLSNT